VTHAVLTNASNILHVITGLVPVIPNGKVGRLTALGWPGHPPPPLSGQE
jgi:hypothetical protein